MSRFNKKCFLASAALHGLLFLVLLVGPAFFVSRRDVVDLPTLDFIPDKVIDEAFYRAPAVRTPQPPKPEPPKPRPPVAVKTPPVQKPTPTPTPNRKPKYTDAKDIDISTTRVRPTVKPQVNPRPSQAAITAAQAIRSATANTSISVPKGGSVSYANYDQMVKTKYTLGWREPETATRDSATATARIVIARDGTILSHELIRASGDPAVDGSVRDTLERITRVLPFPSGAKENTRTYTIEFNLKAKR